VLYLIKDSKPFKVIKYAFAKANVLFSESTINELISILRKPKFDKYLDLNIRISLI
jgi:predicted nucleic acid-binding protein